tara:strand:- start:19 stop:213 length:195 start_codon:yes stop_codon:yes gene_type:complete
LLLLTPQESLGDTLDQVVQQLDGSLVVEAVVLVLNQEVSKTLLVELVVELLPQEDLSGVVLEMV